MRLFKLRASISNILATTEIGVNNIKLSEKLTPEEINDLTNKITFSLPLYPSEQLFIVKDLILGVLPEEERIVIINREIKDLLRLFLLNDINKEQQVLLIFYLMYLWEYSNKGDVNNKLEEVKNYFLSYLIEDPIKLRKEVKLNSEVGITKQTENGYIRVSLVPFLIPTKKTIKLFKNYLFNLKHI
jgi:hypothetical protein